MFYMGHSKGRENGMPDQVNYTTESRIMKKIIIVIIAPVLSLNLLSQQIQGSLADDPWVKYKELSEKSVFHDLKWNTIGPKSIGGHISRITSIPGRSNVIFAVSGWNSVAVWKTTDGGYTWYPVLEKAAEHFGEVAIAPSDPDIVWVGSGEEAWPQRNNGSGAGIFKSVDCGETWVNAGLREVPNITGIAIHHSNPDIVYAAGAGYRKAKALTGIFKTVDGGETWKQVLFADSLKGIDNILMDPQNNDVLYAYSKRRDKESKIQIYKTENGGGDWKLIMKGMPDAENITDIGMDIAASKPNIVYALIKYNIPAPDTSKKEERKIDLFRSENSGESWVKTGEQAIDFGFMVTKVSPDNENEIYLGSVHVWHSTDSGKTIRRIADNVFHIYPNPGTFMHLDQMDLWIDPENTNTLILTNDGGVYRSEDRGKNWLHMNSFPAGEFYYIATNTEEPVEVYGGNQDNSSVYGPGDVNLLDGFPDHWKYVRMDQWSGGDGFFTHPVDEGGDLFYFSYQNGSIVRKNVVTNESKNITPELNGEKLRGAWHTPVIISGYNYSILFYGAKYIMRSVNRGDSWSCISNDLTVSDNEGKSGGEVSSLVESSIYEGLMYAGTSKGLIWCTRDGGGEWADISVGLPEGIITSIAASDFDSARVYVSVSNKNSGDYRSYIYSSGDYGKSWTPISSNIYFDPVNKVIEDTRDKNILYAGTDKGVYVSIDRGHLWNSLSNNLPSCAVNDMVIHEKADMLIAGTYGRGIYSADIGCIREYLTGAVAGKDYYLFDIKPAKEIFIRPNRVRKAVFSFYVNDVPQKDISINVLNEADSILFSMTPHVNKGFNQVTWDLRLQYPVIDTKYYNILGKFLREGKYKVQMLRGKKVLAEKEMIVEKYITGGDL